MANPNQLLLLADHIKLSLLERQRAISLNLEPDSQNGHISRSLDQMREGLEKVSEEVGRLEQSGSTAEASKLRDIEQTLQMQYDELMSQFHGFGSPAAAANLSKPNDPRLSEDFVRASDLKPQPGASSLSKNKKAFRDNPTSPPLNKSVRFSDAPDEDPNRTALFPYRDDPETAIPDQNNLDNQQIHEYHSRVLAEQDEQLDRLGESISRQRDLSIQIGDELDSHVQLLDEQEVLVDRHQSRLDRARKSLGTVARKANDNRQLTTIIVLIIILVLLIIILK